MKFPVVQIHIADIHFGSIDPETQYAILEEQFLKPISTIHFDILSIDGDLFDRKFIASSKAVECASRFIHRCAMLCYMREAALIIISGTESHDAGQLSLFRDLTSVAGGEIHIIENAKFIYTHGLKILCLPEEYGKGYAYYEPLLNQVYDCVFMHGTLAGGVYGANKEDLDARRPVFDIQSFEGCKGPIIAGHVHESMCLKEYMYYVSNPIRYKFGEENPKGYAIVILSDQGHYYRFMPITSFMYKTIDLTIQPGEDPNEVINKINEIPVDKGDKLRIRINSSDEMTSKVISQYYQPMSSIIKIEVNHQNQDDKPKINTTEEILNKYSGMEYLLDPEMTSYGKLSKFINNSLGYSFISEEELKSIYEAK